jgi:hypothetical protein
MNCFCTTVTASHFFQARALARSLRQSGNPEPLHVLLLGARRSDVPADPDLRVLEWDEVGGAAPALMPYYFDAFEFCNAAKPFLVAHLFARCGATKVVYLDADLMIVDRFDRIWRELDEISLILTPHHLQPPARTFRHTNEVDVVDLGFLNGGFTAWRTGAATTAILAWMCDRFPIYGFYRHLGMAADQKLLPLVLAYFPRDVRISHSPALNIAYWNAQERPVRLDGATWRCGDENVLFFHLSGYKLSQPDLVCAYVSGAANAALLAAAPWLRDLAAQYRALLEPCIAGYTPPPYAFTRYDGVHLNADFRRLLFRRGRLSRTDRQFWRIWLVQTLRLLKRLATGVRPLR